jgi:hypothetical protein
MNVRLGAAMRQPPGESRIERYRTWASRETLSGTWLRGSRTSVIDRRLTSSATA